MDPKSPKSRIQIFDIAFSIIFVLAFLLLSFAGKPFAPTIAAIVAVEFYFFFYFPLFGFLFGPKETSRSKKLNIFSFLLSGFAVLILIAIISQLVVREANFLQGIEIPGFLAYFWLSFISKAIKLKEAAAEGKEWFVEIWKNFVLVLISLLLLVIVWIILSFAFPGSGLLIFEYSILLWAVSYAIVFATRDRIIAWVLRNA